MRSARIGHPIALAVWLCIVCPTSVTITTAFVVPNPALSLRKHVAVSSHVERLLASSMGRVLKPQRCRPTLLLMKDDDQEQEEAIQKGDGLLAAAATALAEGDLAASRDSLREARAAYKDADVTSRDALILEIEDRLSTASQSISKKASSPPGSPKSTETLTMGIQQRYRLAKQVGDDFLQEAAQALGEKQFERARELVEMARSSFMDAGDTVFREREPLLQNMQQYIVVEEEREVLSLKRKAKEEKEKEEERRLAKRMEDALLGDLSDSDDELLDSISVDAEELAGTDLVNTDDTDAPPASSDRPAPSDQPDLIVLVDNGSSRPQSTLMLRRIASALSERIGADVVPASMNHADRAPEAELDNESANLFKPLVLDRVSDGAQSVVVVPLFLGPVAAVTTAIPEYLESFSEAEPYFRFSVARTLAQDSALAALLEQEVRLCAEENDLTLPSVVLVDHGSPNPKVTEVRDRLAKEVRGLLATSDVAGEVSAASMERREGEEFAFADPLLENCLGEVGGGFGDVVLSMLFMLPGTHAGEGGDIDEICARALRKAGGEERRVVKTRLLGECEGLVDILERNYELATARLPRRF